MKILITGANGMLGQDVTDKLQEHELLKTDVKELDITNFDEVIKYFETNQPEVVINCAAYTNVDGCEDENNQKIVFAINADGPLNLAIACQKFGAKLVHISTDYVFDGESAAPYLEDDQTNPISVYGQSKLLGEQSIIKNMSNYYILRTAWLYGKNGHNFIETMLKLSQERSEIDVVNDQIGSPTSTKDLALAISEVIKKETYGTYHVVNTGYCSWYDFAKFVFDFAKIDIKVNPVKSDQFKTAAKRPSFSKLETTKFMNNFFKMRDYEEAISDYLKTRQKKEE